MNGYVVALDQGTTSSRAIIFDAKGKPVTIAQYPFPQIYPKPGWVEHDPMVILETQFRALAEAFEKSEINTGYQEVDAQITSIDDKIAEATKKANALEREFEKVAATRLCTLGELGI